MKNIIPILLFFLLTFTQSTAFSQGIRGKIASNEGEALAFASVYIRNLEDGVPTNENGLFEFRLQPGVYDVVFQFLGYQSQVKTVEVQSQWVDLDIVLEPQIFTLSTVEVKAGAEDPALTVMRKAISKAKYHRLQLQKYEMTVYLKGTGQMTDAPFFLKKKLEEEGLKLNEAYTSESVSRITYEQPDKITEKVLSIRTNGDNQGTSPAPYIQTTFYQDQINGIVSPLSRYAFTYYSFKHEGNFFDQNVLVSKIRVTPRSRGEQVFEGFIYIIEDLWAIHSLDLKTSYLGFEIQAKQQYAPVADQVWMPLTHTYVFGGKIFGFEGEFRYLASTRDYEITLNPDLALTPVIIDEKVQDIPDDALKLDKSRSALEQLAAEKPTTRKEYRKLINQYEKELIQESKAESKETVVSERNYSVDTLARKRNLSYWDSIRPVPLTLKEIQGYERDDSLATVEAAKVSEVDSVAKKAKRKFRPMDFMNGGSYALGKGKSIGFRQNWTKMSYNTVEGWKVGMGLFYRKYQEVKLPDSVNRLRKSFNIEPELRYGFSSRRFYGKTDFRWSHTQPTSGQTWGLEAGRFIYQFNSDNPIQEQINALYSILARKNYMKLYEQDFARIYWAHRVNYGFTYRVNFLLAERRELFNNSDYSLYNKPDRSYTPNRPENVETFPSNFANHQIARIHAAIDWRPGLSYSVRNGRKSPNYERSPEITLMYQKAIPGLFGNGLAADFDQIEASIKHSFSFGVSGKLDFNVTGGTFLNSNQVFFQDFKHFGGNRTIFSNIDAASDFRVMDYYRYSTSGAYISSIAHYQFRKFLLTQLPMLRFSGVRENVFVNYLKTENSPHYTEIGYSLDNLFRFFRVEFAAGFENGQFLRARPLFGVATFINLNFD
jgi:hypothetical protein